MDKSKLLAPRADTDSGLPEDDVDIPGVGTVRVRGLSRDEVAGIQQHDGLLFERKMLSKALVDPEMSEADVGQWQVRAPAGEIEPVGEKVRELSGLSEGASKSDLPADGDGPGAGVRALPGGEAVDDGGPATSGDE